MSKKKSDDKKPKVHEELEGFELNINEFGEIESNIKVDKLNDFLNKHVDDKKLRDRDDIWDEGEIDDEGDDLEIDEDTMRKLENESGDDEDE